MYRISALYTRLEYPLRGYIAKVEASLMWLMSGLCLRPCMRSSLTWSNRALLMTGFALSWCGRLGFDGPDHTRVMVLASSNPAYTAVHSSWCGCDSCLGVTYHLHLGVWVRQSRLESTVILNPQSGWTPSLGL